LPEKARGARLDRTLAILLPGESRASLQRLMRDGRVTILGRPARPSYTVRGGERVEVDRPAPRPSSLEPEALPVAILYEDADLLVVDKAAGISVHPGAGAPRGTLVNALLHHCTDLSGIGGVERPGIVHRLDRQTSGVLVVAKNDTTHRALAGQFNLAAGMSTTGSLTRWFQDQMAREQPQGDANALFEAAAHVAPGAGGLVFLPYFSGERTPINDPLARGVIAGLSLAHSRDQVFRAILEGVACGVRHNVETLARIGAQVDRVVAVGGGAQTDTWLQIVSDVAGLRQEVPAITLGACYGDAFLAGCAAGLLRRDQIAEWVRAGHSIEPDATLRPTYDALYDDYLDLYQDSRRVVHRLAGRQGAR